MSASEIVLCAGISARVSKGGRRIVRGIEPAVDGVAHGRLYRRRDLVTRGVGHTQVQHRVRIMFRELLRLAHRALHALWQELHAPAHVQPRAVLVQERAAARERAQLRLREVHQRLHLALRPRKVLERERVHAHAAHVQPQARLEHALERPEARRVPVPDGAPARPRVPPVPVHHERDVRGQRPGCEYG
jgi:hypothetical protein